MRIESQPAYILHARNYRDTSMIVDYLTVDFGKVSGVVKGVRAQGKSAKQRRGLIQPFIPLLISWSGKSELKTMTHHEARTKAIALQGVRLFSGLYVNELLSRLLQPGDEHSEIYTLYEWAIQGLVTEPLIDVLLRNFELKLLEYLGYGVDLQFTLDSGEEITAGVLYRFDSLHGFTAITINEASATNSFTKITAATYRGEDLIMLSKGCFNEQTRRVAKHLCRQALLPHLGTKPLKSRELFR